MRQLERSSLTGVELVYFGAAVRHFSHNFYTIIEINLLTIINTVSLIDNLFNDLNNPYIFNWSAKYTRNNY